MTDTVAPTAILTSAVSSSIGVVIFGIDTGLDYPTLIAGILGGATALSYIQPGNPFKRAFEVITASLLAGYSSPTMADVVVSGLVHTSLLPEGAPTPPSLQLALAFLIAFLAHGVLLPGVRKLTTAMFRRYSND